MLSQIEKEEILSEFPNIKLSYENITHKKVYNFDIILAIPEGTKCFAWFTTFNGNFVCILLELDNSNKKQFKNIKIINTCFSKSLCYGTILYGTVFYSINNPFFAIEDIFLYKDKDFSRENWENKFKQISNILKSDIKQVSYNNSFYVFGLPIILKSYEEFDKITKTNIYNIHSLQIYQLNKFNSFSVLTLENYFNKIDKKLNENKIVKADDKNYKNNENRNGNIIFEVKPDIQNDIYQLYCLDNEYYGLACIPDYKTSVMMNNLFRKIKENNDLDKLEESDDEDEFENPNVDKFVYLDKSYKMICRFNKRFKKWTPIEIASSDTNLNNKYEINNFISKIYESNKKTQIKKK